MRNVVIAIIAGLLALSVIPFFNSAEKAGDCALRTGDDAPWPTFHGDAGRTGNHSGSGPLSNRVLWSNGTGGNTYSSPVVAGDRVFIGSIDGYVYCFNATTGIRYWRFNAGSSLQASPAVTEDGKRIIIGNTNQRVYCIFTNNGTQAWSANVDGGMDASPLIYGGKVFISTLGGSLYCVDDATGTQGWRKVDAGGEASPAAEDGRLFSVGNSRLWCYNHATGAELWNVSPISEFYSSPSASGGCVYLSGGDGSVSCFNASNGSRLWRTATGWVESTSTAAISNGSIYVCVDSQTQNRGGLVKLDASDGRIIWTYQVVGDPYVAPAVAGDHVYFSYARTVSCVNASDHSLIWTYQAASADAYGICSSPAVAYGNVYIGGVESKLFCFGLGEPNRPPAALNLEQPTEIRETSMVLKWNRSSEADFARYELHRSSLAGFLPSQLTLIQPGGNITNIDTLSLNVSGLNYSTNYFFKLRVWDNGYPTMFNDSNEVEGTTRTPNGAPAAVRLFPAEEITPFSIRLSWSVNSDDDFDRYEVHRGVSKGFTPGASTLSQTISQRSKNSTLVENLNPWTIYFFRVRVYDNGSPALRNDSNEMETRTGNTPPAAAVLNPVQMGATSASLSWSVSAEDDFSRYELHFSRNASFLPDNGTLATNQTARQITDQTVENLELARTYHFLVRTYDEGGLWNDSNIVSGTTMNTVPKTVISSPEDGDIYDTRTSVSFNGTSSTDQDKDPLSFHWTSSVDGFLSNNTSFTAILSEGSHRITLYVNDGNGHNVSARISITVNKAPDRPPLLAVVFPLENSEISGVAKIHGTVTDPDGNGSITLVEFSLDKADWKTVDGLTDWSYEWNTSKVANGKHKLAFRAFDGELYSHEVSLNVKVNNIIINLKPSILITGPPSDRALSGMVTITGTATDPEGNISRIEMSLNGGGWSAIVGASSWSYPLDTTTLRNGKHSMQFRAFDGTDFSEPAQLYFTVQNAVPSTSQGVNPLLIIIPVVVIITVVIAVLAILRRRKPGGSAAQPPADPSTMQPPAAQQYLPPAPYQYQPPAAGNFPPQQQQPPDGSGRYPPPYG